MKRPKINHLINYNLYKTRTPISFYFWILISVLFLIYLVFSEMIWQSVLMYSSIVSILCYVIFTRYPCKLFIKDDKLVCQYLVFWIPDKRIDLNTIHSFDYLKGFYDLTTDNPQETIASTICYDSISIKKTDGKYVHFNLNTRFNDFKKIEKLLNLCVKIQKQNTNSKR